jgi:hypothetical protein
MALRPRLHDRVGSRRFRDLRRDSRFVHVATGAVAGHSAPALTPSDGPWGHGHSSGCVTSRALKSAMALDSRDNSNQKDGSLTNLARITRHPRVRDLATGRRPDLC